MGKFSNKLNLLYEIGLLTTCIVDMTIKIILKHKHKPKPLNFTFYMWTSIKLQKRAIKQLCCCYYCRFSCVRLCAALASIKKQQKNL